jgi:hypothetical protein
LLFGQNNRKAQIKGGTRRFSWETYLNTREN